MHLRIKHIITTIIAISSLCPIQAQDDDCDEVIRLNPSLTADADNDIVSIPPFINLDANVIESNGADWNSLRHKAASTVTIPLSIVHIGDSHIQADFATGHTRRLFQKNYGNPGRGLVIPFRMTGTNEPRDYLMKSSGTWKGSKLMKQSPNLPVGFTGVAVTPLFQSTDLVISTLSRTDKKELFNDVTLYCNGLPAIDAVSSDGKMLDYEILASPGACTVMLSRAVSELTLSLSSAGSTVIYGADLRMSGESGVFYHAIGNNGATYASYSSVTDFADGLSVLNPDLVIISLGANEAFGKTGPEDIYRAMDMVVSDIKEANPFSEILLVTPMECQKSTRTRRRRARSFAVNEKIAVMRETILRYGRDKKIATYDWYSVAGDQGASSKWVGEELMAKDRIHHSHKGYLLNGQLLYEALNKALQP